MELLVVAVFDRLFPIISNPSYSDKPIKAGTKNQSNPYLSVYLMRSFALIAPTIVASVKAQ